MHYINGVRFRNKSLVLHILWEYSRRLDQTVKAQFCDPFGVDLIGLPAWDMFNLVGVGHYKADVTFCQRRIKSLICGWRG